MNTSKAELIKHFNRKDGYLVSRNIESYWKQQLIDSYVTMWWYRASDFINIVKV